MKKGGILNPAICSLLAELGHEDEILIVDASYPLPSDANVIDITLTPNVPGFLDVFTAITRELVIESVTLPVEMQSQNEPLYDKIGAILESRIELETEPYLGFRENSLDVKGTIRTAEFSPYASARILCGSPF